MFCFPLTHTAKCAERFKEHRAGSLAFLPGVFGGSGVVLHHLGHEVSHGFRRLILHLAGGVSVDTEGEPCIIVPQHAGDCLDVHTVLESQSCESVPLWHNKDKSENPCVATGWLVCPYSFSTKNGPKIGPTEGGKKPRLYLKDKFVELQRRRKKVFFFRCSA